MRLRQAHAIIEAATALETAELPGSEYGFELAPFDLDHPFNLDAPPDDYMDGTAEFPQSGCTSRVYCIDLKPEGDGDGVTVRLWYGYRPEDPPVLLHETFPTKQNPTQAAAFLPGIGARITQLVIETVGAHEQKLAG